MPIKIHSGSSNYHKSLIKWMLRIESKLTGHWFEPSQAESHFHIPLPGPPLKIGNKQTAPGLLPEKVRAPETPARMPGFERVRVATRADQ